MKKLLYILLLTTFTLNFTACSDDDNTNNEPPLEFDDWNDVRSENYKPEGYNPVLGEWLELGSTKPTSKIIFTDNYEEKLSYLGNNGNWQTPSLLGKYIINDKEIKRDGQRNGGDGRIIIYQYTISKDGDRDILITTLGNEIIKYYREQ